MKRLSIYCCSLLWIFACVTVHAQADKKVIQVRAEAWTGYTESGDGYLFKLLKAVYGPIGYELEYKFCPWKRCKQHVVEGDGDIMLTFYGDEAYINQYIQVHNHPVYVERIGVAYKVSRWPEWQGETMLRGRKLGFIRGYELDKELNVPITFMEAANGKQLWRLLMADRIDFIIDGLTPMKNDRHLYVQNKDDFVIAPLFNKPSYFGFSMSPRGNQLVKEFNQRLLELYQTGEIRQLLQEHNLEWMMSLNPESDEQIKQ